MFRKWISAGDTTYILGQMGKKGLEGRSGKHWQSRARKMVGKSLKKNASMRQIFLVARAGRCSNGLSDAWNPSSFKHKTLGDELDSPLSLSLRFQGWPSAVRILTMKWLTKAPVVVQQQYPRWGPNWETIRRKGPPPHPLGETHIPGFHPPPCSVPGCRLGAQDSYGVRKPS